MVVHNFNPSARETNTGRSLSLRPIGCSHGCSFMDSFLKHWFVSICASCTILSHGFDQFIPVTFSWRNFATHPLEGISNKVWTHFFLSLQLENFTSTYVINILICTHSFWKSSFLSIDSKFHMVSFPFWLKCKSVAAEFSQLSVNLKNYFPSFLKDFFCELKILGWHIFFFLQFLKKCFSTASNLHYFWEEICCYLHPYPFLCIHVIFL